MELRVLPLLTVCRPLVGAGLLALCLPASILAQGGRDDKTAGYGTTDRKTIRLPAVESFAQWMEQRGGAGQAAFGDRQVLANGMRLAQARTKEMRILMQKDPEEFCRQAMPEAQRSLLPSQLQSLVERPIHGRGFFGVYCAGFKPDQPPEPGRRSGLAFEVRLKGASYQAFVFGKWREQKTVLEASIEGVVLGDAIALGAAPTPTQQSQDGRPIRELIPTTTGPNTLLFMSARFSDETSDPIDDATALSHVTVVSNFWLNNSSGIVYLHGLVNPTQVMDIVHITLPQPKSYGPIYNNNFGQLLSDARTAASVAGYNYTNYNLDAVVTTDQGFSYAGRSYVGSQGTHWLAPYVTLRTVGHELGHNLGLYHANYWRTDSTQPLGKDSNPGGYVADFSNGEWLEYGHYFSVMSGQYGSEWDDPTKPHYNPAEKVRLGWLSGSQVQYVTNSGAYRLFRHDHRGGVGTPRAIRIEVPATDYTGYGRRYWLSYRYAPWNTAENWYQNGVEIDVAQTSYGSDGSILLDLTPYSKDQPLPFYNPSSLPGGWWAIDNSDKLDGALIVGRTYSDVAAGIHTTPLDTGKNGPGEEYIDLVINLGSFPSNHPPVITGFTATTNQVDVGQKVDFSVAALDPDGDTLAYSWGFGETQVWTASGLNSPTATKSWPNPGQYRVMVSASDMKGGVATASQIITVGVPPTITVQPVSQSVPVGADASFSVVASPVGAGLSYQWLLNGGSIDGGTASSYTRTNVQTTDAGNYSVRITNSAGTALSSNAVLMVPPAAVTGVLTSSGNPSAPAAPVTFTFTLNALPPAAGVPTGTVQFKIDDTDVGGPALLSQGTAALTTSALGHGLHRVAAEYVGDTNFIGITNLLSPDQFINTPPLPGPDNVERDPTNITQVSIVTLLSNDTDADGDFLTFVAVSANSANGGTVVSNGGWVVYTPPPGFTNSDTFTYIISDGLGPPVSGLVTVNVRTDNGPPPNLTITSLGNGVYAIRGEGIPSRTYRIEFSETPNQNWQTLGMATSDAIGIFVFTDASGSEQKFYRAVYP